MSRYSGISALGMLLMTTIQGCQQPAAVAAEFTAEDQSAIRKMFEATPGYYKKQLAVFRREPGSVEWRVVAASFNTDLPDSIRVRRIR